MKLFRTLAVLLLLVTAAFAAQTNYGKFSLDAPVALTANAPETKNTKEGQPVTLTLYVGTLPNHDVYAVGVGDYPFVLPSTSPQDEINGFVKSVTNGKLLSSRPLVVDGQPALASIVSADDGAGRELRFAVVSTYKGKTAYMFLFGSYLDTKDTDNNAVAQFFSSIELQ